MIAPKQAPDDPHRSTAAFAGVRTPVAWGVVWGGLQAVSPRAFFWLDNATVYALGLSLIAAVYIGFSVADGRSRIVVVETGVATARRSSLRADGNQNVDVDDRGSIAWSG
jgi:hypothetical protein